LSRFGKSKDQASLEAFIYWELEMQYQDQTVGDVSLQPDAPMWLVQLANSLQNVERSEYLRHIQAFNARVSSAGRDKATEQARALVAQFGLVQGDVFKSNRRASAAPKFRDPVTGMTWSGRGRPPTWLGKDKDAFKI
jgi:DNA-binding protein H-NS